MMIKAPETEDLDGSPFPLGSTTTYETIKILGLSVRDRSPSKTIGSYYIPVDQEA
jgi:hypothetical protein